MSIIYTLLAKGNDKVLCEYTEYQGNFEQVSRTLLKKVQSDHRASFSYDDAFYFHYANEDTITIMCMCDNKYPAQSAFGFMEHVRKTFHETFSKSEVENAISYSLNSRFKKILRKKMEFFNSEKGRQGGEGKEINQLKSAVLETKEVVLEATHEISQRGEKINLIVKKAEMLRKDSGTYLETAQIVKRRTTRMKRLRVIFFLIFVLLTLFYFITVIYCGGFDFEGCRSE